MQRLTSLPRNQVPEWSSAYIDYKGLKKLIKAAAEAVRDGAEPDLAGQSCLTVNVQVRLADVDHKKFSILWIETWRMWMHSTIESLQIFRVV